MISQQAKVNVLGVEINRLTMRECVEFIIGSGESRAPIRVVTANPEMVYLAATDIELRDIINSADLVTPDGVGIVWAANKMGRPVPERVTGIDLIQATLPEVNKRGWRVFMLGAKPGVAAKAIEKLSPKYPDIVWESEHGYFLPNDEELILQRIRQFNPHVLLVGLGVPRQEYFLAQNKGLAPVCIGVGGSFDTLAGNILRAPRWIQNLKMEWFYRLFQEPKRWKRQSVLPLFVLKIFFDPPKKNSTKRT